MPIASRLKWYLDVNRADYEVVAADEKDSEGAPFSKDQLVVSQLFQDLPGGAFVAGVPATDHARWKRSQALLKRLPELRNQLRELRTRLAALESRLPGED